MAGVRLPDVRPWGRRALTIPPDSRNAWLRLAIWEMWIGMLICVIFGLGVLLIASAPDRIVTVADLTGCYALPPIPVPCDRLVYRGGVLNTVFTAAVGLMLVGVAVWFVWELWTAVEPKPITDDFLRLLNDSFGRDWRNPLTWPWARMGWAYGFTVVGAGLAAGAAVMLATFLAASNQAKAPTVQIETSQSYRLGD